MYKILKFTVKRYHVSIGAYDKKHFNNPQTPANEILTTNKKTHEPCINQQY